VVFRSPSNQRSVAEHYRRLNRKEVAHEHDMERRAILGHDRAPSAATASGPRRDTGRIRLEKPLVHSYTTVHWTFVTRGTFYVGVCQKITPTTDQTIWCSANKILLACKCAVQIPKEAVGSGRSSCAKEAFLLYGSLFCQQSGHRQPEDGISYAVRNNLATFIGRSGRTRALQLRQFDPRGGKSDNNQGLIQRTLR